MENLISILRSCTNFKAVYLMEEYLALLNTIKPLADYPITPTFTEFIRTTVICLHHNYVFPTNFIIRVRHSHNTLVDAAVSMIMPKKVMENIQRIEEPVQTLGYTCTRASGEMIKNPMITLALKSLDWENLHKYIGDELIMHIIKGENLSVFVKNNNSLIQVIGINMAKFIYTKDPKRKKMITAKKMKEVKIQQNSIKNFKKPNDILSKLPLINKERMLYNPVIKKKFKLPSKHFLNFSPRQAGKKIAEKILGAKSKGKYLENLSNLFGIFAYNYQRLNIGSHINKHCPLPKELKGKFTENIEENFTFEWLFSNNCSLIQVGIFIITLIKKVIPLDLIGGKHNMKALEKSLILFLKLGIWEKISCGTICTRFKMSGFKWIKETADTSRKLLVGKIILFIFNDFIVPVMQMSFYITEKQHDNTILYYYRKPVWALVAFNAKQKLESTNFLKPLSSEEKACLGKFIAFPPAKLRVQPKAKDFRPIMHFKSKISITPTIKLSGNNLLAGLPQILRNCLLNSSDTQTQNSLSPSEFTKFSNTIICLDYPTIVSKIRNFQILWEEKNKPNLFYMSIDIAKAFDSIDINNMVKLLEKLETPIITSYYKYIQLLPKIIRKPQGPIDGLFKMKFKKKAVDEGKFPFFQDLSFRSNSINILTSRTSFATSEKIKMVSKIIQGNVIIFNRKYFKGQRGVPQGLSCSPFLSNMYYSNIEQELLPIIKEKQTNDLLLIIRLHDDYLILSDNQNTVKDIFNEMEKLAYKHNYHYAHNKICSNIPGDWQNNLNIEGWVGLDVSKNLNISPHVGPEARKLLLFDFVTSSINITDIKNKLIKMTNITINLLMFRASDHDEVIHQALGKLMNLQACRFLALLKIVRKVYKCRHSACAISRIIVNVVKFSAKLVRINEFVETSLKEFERVFKGTELHSVSRKLKGYLGNSLRKV